MGAAPLCPIRGFSYMLWHLCFFSQLSQQINLHMRVALGEDKGWHRSN
jgi:hypothetical protein